MRHIPKATPKLRYGYVWAAGLFARRRIRVEAWDSAEAKAWGKMERYCMTMAKYRLIDYADDPKQRQGFTVTPTAPDRLAQLVADETDIDLFRLVTEPERQIEERPIREAKRLALAAALRLLSPKERIVARLHYGDEWSRETIAKYTGMERNTVDKHLSNAQKKFAAIRADLAEPEGFPSERWAI